MTTHFRTLVYGALAMLSVTSCAAAQPYNPDALGDPQLARVADICQHVMGLDPHERLSSGYWLGNSRLDFDTSHYRGCVLSLSDSLQHVSDRQATQQADAACRAQGLQPDTPELALCVLRSANGGSSPPPLAQPPASLTPVAQLTGQPPSGSFFRASPHETARREEVACAALGLSPANEAFKGCVRQLDNTFYAIDNPIE